MRVVRHEEYPPVEHCRICEGDCCKRLPGLYHPSDFSRPITVDYLIELLQLRWAAVDWWENPYSCGPGYFLRPPCSNDNGSYFRGSWGGSCIYLETNGCTLPFEDRPLGCRSLRPGRNTESDPCKSTYGKYEAYRSWARYRKTIVRARDLLAGS